MGQNKNRGQVRSSFCKRRWKPEAGVPGSRENAVLGACGKLQEPSDGRGGGGGWWGMHVFNRSSSCSGLICLEQGVARQRAQEHM